MLRFKWIGWNIDKISVHGLSTGEVESAFRSVLESTTRADDSVETLALLPSGRPIQIIWRYDREEEIPDVFGEVPAPAVFVITAYRV